MQTTLTVRLLFATALFSLSALSCTSQQTMKETATPAEGTAVDIAKVYEQKIEAYSAGDTEYSGFYNNFEYKATLKNTAIRETLLAKRASYYQWEPTKLDAEKAKDQQELASITETFVSFFTPDRNNDNLTDKKSIWRIYLDVGGRRYEGKPLKIRGNLAELQSLYPYHTRWNTPYTFQFQVPTTAVETQSSTLTITGPLGTRSVTFKPVQ
ncbi:MAG: hypothetical protein V4760_17570 [Bdellovibrionota bacterium]